VPQLPVDLRDLVVEGSEGNPFYVEELIKILIEDGVIGRGEDRWQVSLDRLADVRVPPSLTAVLQARLDSLPVEERGLLQRASVVGREFWDQAVGELAADAIAKDEVVPLLGSLRAREMVYRRERSAFAGTQEYTFKHSVLRDVAYQTVLLKVRQRYHGQVAAWLQAHAGERLAEYYGLIAAHYELAGDAERALEHLLQAGDRARSLAAYREATAHYERALVILRDGGDIDRTARVLMKLGLTYHSAFQFDESRRAYDEGFALWQRAGLEKGQTPVAEQRPAPHPLRVRWMPVETLDPAYAIDTLSTGVIKQLFSGLVALSPDGTIEPDLARSWEVLDDGRRYVFHLRDDVVWSDGVSVTAADFEYAWKRVLDPATASRTAHFLYVVKGGQDYHQGRAPDAERVGIAASDDTTLVVELERPTGYFVQLLMHAATFPVPRHVVQVSGSTWTEAEHIVTNGAFRLARWNRGSTIILDRSPSFHGRFHGNVCSVRLLMEDALSRLNTYDRDQLDILNMSHLAPEQADRARHEHAEEYVPIPLPGAYLLEFDVSRLPFDDRRVRRAIALATDREHLASVVGRGLQFPASGGLIPLGMPGHSPGIGLPYDPEAARRLLTEAGYPGGRDFPVIEALGVSAYLGYLGEAWLDSLGIEVRWSSLPLAEIVDRLWAPELPRLRLIGCVADYADPDCFLRAAPWRRRTNWHDQAFDALTEEAHGVTDHEHRICLYQQADKILVEEAPVVPLTYLRRHYLMKPWVKSPSLARRELFYKDFTIERH
jgi:oligopeptide transport system substrate-binding protein